MPSYDESGVKYEITCAPLPFVFAQIWMRCFVPVDVKHREKLWGALAPSALDGLDFAAGRWHRQLVCGLVTLFAQVTESETLGTAKRNIRGNETVGLTKRSGSETLG